MFVGMLPFEIKFRIEKKNIQTENISSSFIILVKKRKQRIVLN